MRLPGSVSGSPVAPAEPNGEFARQKLGDVAEFLLLVRENIFGDAAREGDAGRRDRPRQRFGELQSAPEPVERRADDLVDGEFGEPRRDGAPDFEIGEALRIGGEAELVGHQPRRIVDARPATFGIGGDEPAADGKSGDAEDRALVDQGELRRAAAHIDMQHAFATLARQRDGARAMRGERAFELVSGGGADELAGLFGEQLVDRAGVAALDRFAGEDHRAAVDVAARDARRVVGIRG